MQEKTFHISEEHAQAGDPPSRVIIDQNPADIASLEQAPADKPVVLRGGVPGGVEFHAI